MIIMNNGDLSIPYLQRDMRMIKNSIYNSMAFLPQDKGVIVQYEDNPHKQQPLPHSSMDKPKLL